VREGSTACSNPSGIIIIGAVIGALAKFIIPGSDHGGFFVTAPLGMAGAVVATLLGRFVGL
jgi:uncharacterized membrane protein YeaQ/YmgE (transglycosylase-associated protein family)